MKNLIVTLGIYFIVATLLFSCEKSDASLDLIDYDWKVKSVENVPLGSQADERFVLRFSNDSSSTIKLDVNSCFTSYKITGKDKIDFGVMGCTKICCDSDFAQSLAKVLDKVTDYHMEGNLLYLTGGGEIILEKYK